MTRINIRRFQAIKTKLISVALLFIAFFISIPSKGDTRNVVFVDVSGSVGGYGWDSENLIEQYKKQIGNFQHTNKDVAIIPFASHILGTIDNAESLTIAKGNTNLKEPFNYVKRCQEKADGNYNFFILTDGKHNVGVALPELYALADSIKSILDNSKVYCYFVAFSEKSKQSAFAALFDGKHHFVLLDSLYIPNTHSDSVAEIGQIKNVAVPPVKQSNKTDLSWAIWAIIILLLLIITAIAFYYILLPLLKVMLSGLSQIDKAKLISDMKSSPLLKKRICEDSKNIGRWSKAQLKSVDESKLARTDKGGLPVNYKYAGSTYYFDPALNKDLAAKLQDGHGAYKVTTSNGEPYYVVDNVKTANKMGLKEYQYRTVDRLRSEFPEGVPFEENGLPDFSNCIIKDAKTGKPIVVELPDGLTETSLNDRNIAQRIAEARGVSFPEGVPRTWHHVPGTNKVILVNQWPHAICKHSGGRAITQL